MLSIHEVLRSRSLFVTEHPDSVCKPHPRLLANACLDPCRGKVVEGPVAEALYTMTFCYYFTP